MGVKWWSENGNFPTNDFLEPPARKKSILEHNLENGWVSENI